MQSRMTMNNTEVNQMLKIHRPFAYRNRELRRRIVSRKRRKLIAKITYPIKIFFFILIAGFLLISDWIYMKLNRRLKTRILKYNKFKIEEGYKK
jgi:hypothetical protein